MKKTLSFALLLSAVLLCLVGCGGDRYVFESFYGVVRFSETCGRDVVYIPEFGEVEIPESEHFYPYKDTSVSESVDAASLKRGDLVAIYFRYEKSWDENSVKVMEMYPAKFDRGAYGIEVLRENISFGKDDTGYVFSFPITKETEDAAVGDTLYFIEHGGENGRAYRKLSAEGKILKREDGIFTVSLSIKGEESEFLPLYMCMTVERHLPWDDPA